MTPSLRYASLSGYIDLAHSLDLDPASLMSEVGLDPAGLAVPDRWIPAIAVCRLLELSAQRSGCEDFCLRLAEFRRLSTLGPLSLALGQEPSLRDALDLLLRYEHTYNEAIRMRLSEEGGLATIRLWFELGEPVATQQAEDLAVAALLGIIRALIGKPWEPLSTCLSHRPPADPEVFARRLGGRIHCEHDFTGIVMYARDLDVARADLQSSRHADPDVLRSLAGASHGGVSDRVKELVEVLLPTGRCAVAEVASTLGVDRRTLHRHLGAEGTTFSAIVEATRAGLAERYLSSSRYPLTEVSQLLGFAAPSGFTRWFGQHFGESPTQWRRVSRGGQPTARS